ncbi:hypothetical protein C5E45_00950 [Nocardia nova]|uniref:Uncharacterized protein n=1 Tax=Nocardia nova TaxID=37330 RepID=A0A2S6AWX4_9NOCA|nr:hypothetical protein [Nocardia nova]PPJ39747.1 hypothetical protein C5E45_00950 [Nocardia nova]
MTIALDFETELVSADEPVLVAVGDPVKRRQNIEQVAATQARLMGEETPPEVWEAAGLVPRPVHTVPAWDYHAAAARYAAEVASGARSRGMHY